MPVTLRCASARVPGRKRSFGSGVPDDVLQPFGRRQKQSKLLSGPNPSFAIPENQEYEHHHENDEGLRIELVWRQGDGGQKNNQVANRISQPKTSDEGVRSAALAETPRGPWDGSAVVPMAVASTMSIQ